VNKTQKLKPLAKKKGISLGQIPQIFQIALVIGITVGIAYIVLVAFSNSANTSNYTRAVTGIGYMLTFMDNIASNMPIVGFVIFGVIVLYLLNMYQQRQGKKGDGA
jgi:hypothetical protein